MKKGIKIILLALFLLPLSVQAAGKATISGASSVEVGSNVTVTVTLTNTASWNIKIISAGSTSGCTQSFADATSNGKDTTKKLSVTCKATSIGIISFTVTGDITSADGSNANVSLSKRITVTPVREKSTDANLASITLEGYELTPKFNKDTLEYSVTLPSTVNSINLSAKANESHASVAGIGTFEVTEGLNTFQIVVTAENGAQKTYVVKVNEEDTNPIEVKVGNGDYTIIKNAKSLVKPDLYEETTVQIDGVEVPAFYSDITGFTLVGLKDEEGKIKFAIYDTENNTYQIYNELNSNTTILYLIDFPNELKGYLKGTIIINDTEVHVYKLKEDSRFVICYGMNVETGEYDYYSYDTKEGTFQVWNQDEISEVKDDLKTYSYAAIIFGVGLLFAFILIIILLNKKKKHPNKKINKKDNKNDQDKNQKNKEEEVLEKDDLSHFKKFEIFEDEEKMKN